MSGGGVPRGHITLKEASRISGYAPDYIGSLIRRGKIYGKQVYLNAAWVTSESALRGYMAREDTYKASRADASAGPVEQASPAPRQSFAGIKESAQQAQNVLLSDVLLTRYVRSVLYVLCVASFFALLALFYVLSVNIDRTIEQRAIEHALGTRP